jgi:DNA mismatch repair protein MutS2
VDAARTLAEFARITEDEIARRAAALVDTADTEGSPPVVGEQVEVRGTAIRGELVELLEDRARIRRGAVTFEVSSALLRRPSGPGAEPSVERPHTEPGGTGAPTELNLVGLRASEAVARLDHFLDQAQAADTRTVRIVHGIGTGALKRAVAEYLKASPYCARFRDAEPQQGGSAVTIAELV